ncbi:MAG: cystathionine gamma-synthase [Armatimonadaceae bacterium]
MADAFDPAETGFSTRAIHVGQAPDPQYGAVTTPIYQTATFAFRRIGETYGGYDYGRSHNPTRTALEQVMASLESAKHALSFSTGMAAINAVLSLLKPGDHVLINDDVYGGTYRLLSSVFGNYGITFSLTDQTDLDKVEAAIRPETKLVWIETPTNPLMKVVDIAAIAERAHARGAWVAVDNTFASPYLQRPLLLGADFVIHSATKYLGGHSDVVNGILAVNDDSLRARLYTYQNTTGCTPGPLDCYLVLRGIKTLGVRMRQHSANALALAQFLDAHPQVEEVLYPGLPGDRYHEVNTKNFASGGAGDVAKGGHGGMLSFRVRGGEAKACAVVEKCRVFTLAESLGGVESLIEVPVAMTHASLAGSDISIDPSMIRVSVGIEDAEDLIADLEQALA